MATNDGSLASLTEDWIVTQIRAIEVLVGVPAFEDVDVAAWEGTVHENAKEVLAVLAGGVRSPVVRVRFRRDQVEPLEAGEQRLVATYDIFVGVTNRRHGGAARRGDGYWLGTNRMRDMFYAAVHDKRPGLTAGGRTTDKTRWFGSEGVLDTTNESIIPSVLQVHEVPAA